MMLEVPGPGDTSTLYNRVRVTDEAGLSIVSAWGSYYADGTDPVLIAHKPQGLVDCTLDVSLAVTLQDEARMDRAQVRYSYGGSSYTNLNMTKAVFNVTNLGATASLNKSRIPMTVSYYFVFWDAAGNMNTSKVHSYNTRMRDLVEGAYSLFDSTVLTSTPPYNKWEWDFDYTGSTLDVDKVGKIVRYTFQDNGTYTIALRLTDTEGNSTLITFDVVVLDGSPLAVIKEVDSVLEGTTFTLDATWSSSWPDLITKYEWDLDYDGTTFTPDVIDDLYNHTILDDGTYRIALRVTDDDGSVGLTDISVKVLDGRPTLGVTYPQTWDEGFQLSLNASGSSSWRDALDRIEWDLDYDGTFSIGQIGTLANFTYMDDGDYQIVVRAFDDDGSMSEFQGSVTVLDLLPTANITTTAMADEGSPLEFNGNLSASFPDVLSTYEWDFYYDGTFDPSCSPSVSSPRSGGASPWSPGRESSACGATSSISAPPGWSRRSAWSTSATSWSRSGPSTRSRPASSPSTPTWTTEPTPWPSG